MGRAELVKVGMGMENEPGRSDRHFVTGFSVVQCEAIAGGGGGGVGGVGRGERRSRKRRCWKEEKGGVGREGVGRRIGRSDGRTEKKQTGGGVRGVTKCEKE